MVLNWTNRDRIDHARLKYFNGLWWRWQDRREQNNAEFWFCFELPFLYFFFFFCSIWTMMERNVFFFHFSSIQSIHNPQPMKGEHFEVIFPPIYANKSVSERLKRTYFHSHCTAYKLSTLYCTQIVTKQEATHRSRSQSIVKATKKKTKNCQEIIQYVRSSWRTLFAYSKNKTTVEPVTVLQLNWIFFINKCE